MVGHSFLLWDCRCCCAWRLASVRGRRGTPYPGCPPLHCACVFLCLCTNRALCAWAVSVRSQRVSGTAVSGHGSNHCVLSACTSGVTYQWCLGKFSSHYNFLDKALSFLGWSVRSMLKQREGWVEGGMCLCSSCSLQSLRMQYIVVKPFCSKWRAIIM